MAFGSKGKKRDQAVDQSIETLRAACDRNLPLEVFRSSGLGAPPVARGRLLKLTDNELMVEQVREREGEIELHRGQQLDCFFVHADEIYGFRSRVRETDRRASLNGKTRVEAISLMAPSKVDVTQRRARYRVSLASLDPRIRVGIQFAEIIPAGGGRWKEYEIADASGLGIGAVTEDPTDDSQLEGMTCFVRFKVSGMDEAVIVKGQVRRVLEIARTEGVRIGIQFLPWPTRAELEESLEPFEEFLMTIQRSRMNKGVA